MQMISLLKYFLLYIYNHNLLEFPPLCAILPYYLLQSEIALILLDVFISVHIVKAKILEINFPSKELRE